jgi:hypothetical protein
MAITKCAFEGCRETTEQPDKDGWTYFADVKPFSHGLYCHAHAHVLEQVLLEPPDNFAASQKPPD